MSEILNKVLILGSGALKIGEAGEFDYSGSQAIKALKEENIKTILVNPNIATIQTSDHLADKVYFLPVDDYFVEKIIKKERPQGIMLSFGGQTALNCGVALKEKGILDKYNVKVLGTPVEVIQNTEDRHLFTEKLKEINCSHPNSRAVNSLEQAIEAASIIGFPLMLRNAYALGGMGSGLARNLEELTQMVKKNLTITKQILIEEYLGGWKEIEYEVVRDKFDNCITVCNMENFDPMGIHTGESIVVAPSQTLNNFQYHHLRDISIKVIRHLGVIGECNIQFAQDPNSNDYRIIEVNARLSRSSALASKATGYPLAFIAAKLALGYSLTNLNNSITKITKACFEPALDYLAIKMPRWDLKKFRKVSTIIGSEMKSVGEVMAIGRSFEEAIQKALRMLNVGVDGILANNNNNDDTNNGYKEEILRPTPERIFAIAEAMKKGETVDTINQWSKIDKWFLYKIKNIVETSKQLKALNELNKDQIIQAKKEGFSDKQIARLMGKKEFDVREYRKNNNIIPYVKQIDTLAAEYPAKTNYLYLTYHAQEDDINFESARQKVIILGSGAYCIGSSVEFDWCCVNAAKALKKTGVEIIMLNCNPETVSTDYDECDKLYFEELTLERVLDIQDKELAAGMVVSMGGQIPNNLSLKLHKVGVKVIGTSPENIDRAENRHKFSALLDKLDIDQPAWEECSDIEKANQFAKRVGYPVLIRPSYVLSGAAMSVAFNEKELNYYLTKAANINRAHPVVVTKFILGAKEIEIDAVAQRGKLINWVVTEHVENAGVHSGDASIIMPAQKIYLVTMNRVKQIARELARELQITGPFNIQFLAKDNRVRVIECNLRASRTMPFISKASKVNFIELAVKAFSDEDMEPLDFKFALEYVVVKAPQFSFSRLAGADPLLAVEMSSTGEVACFGNTVEEAFLKALIATGFRLPEKNILLSLGGIANKSDLLNPVKKLIAHGYEIFATPGTANFLAKHNVPNQTVYKMSENKTPNLKDYLENRKIDLVINTTDEEADHQIYDDYLTRRKAVDFNIPLITNLQAAKLLIRAITELTKEDLQIKSWDEYK